MKKVSITDYAQKVAQEHGDKANVVLLVAIKEEAVEITAAGIGQPFLGYDAVRLADALQTLLDTKLRAASVAAKQMRTDGVLRSEIINKTERKTGTNNNGESSDVRGVTKDEAKNELMNVLKDIIEEIFETGGKDDEDDG